MDLFQILRTTAKITVSHPTFVVAKANILDGNMAYTNNGDKGKNEGFTVSPKRNCKPIRENVLPMGQVN